MAFLNAGISILKLFDEYSGLILENTLINNFLISQQYEKLRRSILRSNNGQNSWEIERFVSMS